MSTTHIDRTFDAELELKDSGAAVTADALATVGGSTKTITFGDAHFQGDLVIDLDAAVDTTTGDEYYRLQLIGSNDATFASGVTVLATVELGDATQLAGAVGGVDTDKGAAGDRFLQSFSNEQGGVNYAYGRLVCNVSGTTPSITYRAWIAKRQ